MKSITVTAWRRPKYLAQMLESLRVCPLKEEYELFFGLEPGCEETIAVAKSVDWIKTHIHINRKRLGVRKNPYHTMLRTFDAGSIMNVYLEEDIIIAPDTLEMANWYLETQPEDKWLSLNLLNYESSKSEPDTLIASKRFNALGMCIRVHSWKQWFKPNWLNDEAVRRVYGVGIVGWDWSIGSLMAENKNLLTLTPTYSRSNHIGREDGVHASPDFHDRTFNKLLVSDKTGYGTYIIRQDPRFISSAPNGQG